MTNPMFKQLLIDQCQQEIADLKNEIALWRAAYEPIDSQGRRLKMNESLINTEENSKSVTAINLTTVAIIAYMEAENKCKEYSIVVIKSEKQTGIADQFALEMFVLWSSEARKWRNKLKELLLPKDIQQSVCERIEKQDEGFKKALGEMK